MAESIIAIIWASFGEARSTRDGQFAGLCSDPSHLVDPPARLKEHLVGFSHGRLRQLTILTCFKLPMYHPKKLWLTRKLPVYMKVHDLPSTIAGSSVWISHTEVELERHHEIP